MEAFHDFVFCDVAVFRTGLTRYPRYLLSRSLETAELQELFESLRQQIRFQELAVFSEGWCISSTKALKKQLKNIGDAQI